MRVFRLCNSNEIERIIENKSLAQIGKSYKIDPIKNTHQYVDGKKYMHFFKDEIDLLYLSPQKGKHICVYYIPDDLLKESKGYGNYADFVLMEKIERIEEYAIPSEKMKLGYLKIIYMITEDIDFDYYPKKEEIYNCLSCMVDLTKSADRPKFAERDEK